ncbi:MFS transporter [Cupriavidus consociatus]|uniref:MFS transporter n=1 Tax=Cupriavidus consociatus TaxID=2821357 RepID=UPI001AE791B4|nr:MULTISPECIES: MFS transporter [unclassified Cupriavidus]MBP0623692.1 MFS transporter [Cupriavidus sp. LEh25]MDK2660396.1 MFS transporter [Cupriavidus sp. LEh21]
MTHELTHANPVDIGAVLDGPATGYKRTVVVLICFAIVAFEGFDAAIIGFLAPQIAVSFDGAPAQVATAIAAGMLGLLIGYMGSGRISDRRGRRPVLIAGALIFAAASIASAYSSSLRELTIWRLVTGIGIGAAMPALAALLAEILPSSKRPAMLTAVFCGFLFGSALAGILTGQLFEKIGWSGMFILGGIAPLLCIPAVLVFVPESPKLLAVSGAGQEKVKSALRRLGYSVSDEACFDISSGQDRPKQGSVLALFDAKFRWTTVLLWALTFLILGSFYVIASWLPTLIRDGGANVAAASKTAALFQSGGLVGAFVAACAIRKLPPLKIVSIALFLGAMMPLWVASPSSTPLYAIGVFLAGFLISGPIVVISAVSALAYPTSVRSVGVGWASSFGRLGSFVSAGSTGWLVQLGIPLNQLISCLTLTVLACALLAFLLSRALRGLGDIS